MDVQEKLTEAPCSHPQIEEHQIYEQMNAAKKTDSVPGDIPSSILKEFLPEFVAPVTTILKQAVETHTWPNVYKKEYHLPLKKIPAPQDEDDIRGIGLTSWVSKQLERLVLNWIWPFIHPQINTDQMGGMPGCSVEHYIIKMIHFIMSSMDGNHDIAVLAMPVDFSKAFNRMLHSDILCDLFALNVPKCAIKLVKSYLTRRSMCVTYKGEVSTFQACPGGGPQGGLLTGILFIIQVNKAGSPCIPKLLKKPSTRLEEGPESATGLEGVKEPSTWQEDGKEVSCRPERLEEGEESTIQSEYVEEVVDLVEEEVDVATRRMEETEAPARLEDGEEPTTWMEEEEASAPGLDDVDESPTVEVHSSEPVNWLPPCHSASKLHKKSFIDDLTLLEKVSLSQLIEKKRIIGPLNYHDRFNLTLPHNRSILQHQVGDLQIFTKERHMKLNNKKTKCIPFNNSLTKDFMPQIWIEDNEALEVIYQLKLVGLVINSALNWTDHVDYTIGRVNKILWQITRFRQLGAPREKLITLYILKVRSVLMFGAVSVSVYLVSTRDN